MTARAPQGNQVGFKVFLPLLPGIDGKTRMEAEGKVLRVGHTRGRKECEGLLA